jgi:hypothetical protein
MNRADDPPVKPSGGHSWLDSQPRANIRSSATAARCCSLMQDVLPAAKPCIEQDAVTSLPERAATAEPPLDPEGAHAAP